MIEVRPATEAELAVLANRTDDRQQQLAEVERFAAQERGEGALLVAWDGDVIRGRVRLRWWSKYIEVLDSLGEFPEINALDAWPQGTGVGTRIIEVCEEITVKRGDTQLGIAVVTTNLGARRLYDRLGFEYWGDVIDETPLYDADGNVVRIHKDPCVYLVKHLG